MAIALSNKTDEELEKEQRENGLIPKDTIVDFEVLDEVKFGTKTIYTEDAQSKAGNDMIVLVLKIFHNDKERVLIDYLTAGMEFKLRHAINTCGIDVDTAVSATDFIGKSGRARLGIQKSKDPQYSDKNVIADYLVRGVDVELDDEIPDFTKK